MPSLLSIKAPKDPVKAAKSAANQVSKTAKSAASGIDNSEAQDQLRSGATGLLGGDLGGMVAGAGESVASGMTQGLGTVGSLAGLAAGGLDDILTWSPFADAATDAVQTATDEFRLKAKFQGLSINALTALGAPGCLDGPDIAPLMKKAPVWADWTGDKAKVRDIICEEYGAAFDKWRENVTVPGLPWYPAFTAFPAPTAPPMPNVPMPLSTCVSSGAGAMAGLGSKLSSRLATLLPGSNAQVLVWGMQKNTEFLAWLNAQMVMNVLGKGPIPSFAPPYVPVGPVVMGDNIATPGHLVS